MKKRTNNVKSRVEYNADEDLQYNIGEDHPNDASAMSIKELVLLAHRNGNREGECSKMELVLFKDIVHLDKLKSLLTPEHMTLLQLSYDRKGIIADIKAGVTFAIWYSNEDQGIKFER